MVSEKTLKLFVYVDGVNDVPFYGDVSGTYEEYILANGELYETSDGFVFNVRHANEQIEIGTFRYDAKRMGGAPTISFTLMYEDCLDNFWNENVYAVFNNEKFFLKQTPTSSKSNEDARYRHDVELISARAILDNVLFYDAVVGDPQGEDKPVSNSTKFVFFGKIDEFARRLNASLQYAKLQKVDENGEYESGYRVIVDNGITSEAMFVSFEDQYFSNAIQESYNTFKVPYYFVGEDIHFGNSNNVIEHEFSYGIDDALLSITKSNANNKIVNRVTGTGSSDNLPYYYPNSSPKGTIEAKTNGNFEVTILDNEVFANSMQLDEELKKTNATYELQCDFDSGETFSANFGAGGKKHYFDFYLNFNEVGSFSISLSSRVTKYILQGNTISDANFETQYLVELSKTPAGESLVGEQVFKSKLLNSVDNVSIPISDISVGYHLTVTAYYEPTGKYQGKGGNITYNVTYSLGSKTGWTYNGEPIAIEDFGLKTDGNEVVGSTITQKLVNRVKTSNVLLPPKYRDTNGEERFYNAINGLYTDENGNAVVFNNPFVEGQPKEHIISVDDIKPTIKEAVNASGLRLDMFTAFAYDVDDNDDTYVNEEGETFFKHPYFFGKLRVLDFNLFECANENQPMTISFTSGHCGACNFEIGATEDYPQLNPVQVTGEGELIYKDGRVWCGVEGIEGQAVTEYQPRQQDTSKYEVWIALKKEENTYGTLMPSEDIRPKACSSATANDGDTFVILGINLPQAYIDKAENKLEAEIVKYMKDNNDEKFNFSITLSRIFFAENPTILEQLNENASLYVWYNGVRYPLYVSSISYNMGEGDALPEVRLELVDSLSVSQNAIQQAVSQVKAQMGNALANLDVLTAVSPFFIRKDIDDEVNTVTNFKKGIKFGEGGKIEVMNNNSAKLTIEYLEVTKKATFTSLEIQEKTHVGGQMLITPAAMNCGEVEEFDNYYRCYFQTQGENGEEIFNQFAVNDQAICQTFNAWGSRYFWRLVTAIGEDYIDLSKEDCDEYSDIPMAGDKIIQLGHRTDKSRQSAIVLSSYGETSPSFIMYKDIKSYSLDNNEVTGILWNPVTQEPQMYSYGSFFFGDNEKDESGELIGDFITFQPSKDDPTGEKKLYINANVTFGKDSKGLSDLSEWTDFKKEVEDDYVLLEGLFEQLLDQIDGVVENYFLEGDPSTNKAPVTEWTTNEEKLNHVGDTYTNIEEFVDEATTPNAGKSWRWCECTALTNITDYVEVTDKNGNIKKLHWHPIADTDALKALEMAARAQATADGKRRVFTDKPYPPYDEGDLWITDGKELMVCNTPKIGGQSFSDSDWIKATKYTDDTSLESFIENDYATDLKNLSTQIDKKAETWYQSSDPSDSWNTEALKLEHSGDMWYNTSNGTTQRWDGGYWEKQNIPNEVFDTIDSKKSIYVEKPSSYEANDLWILEKAYTLSGVEYGEGEMVIAKQSSDSFNPEHWTKATKYTDGSNTKNLLPNSAEMTSSTSEYSYVRILLPVRINAGEKYTFKCESSAISSGSDSSYIVYFTGESNNTWYSNKHELSFGENQSVTIKINDTANGVAIKNNLAWLVLLKKTAPSNYKAVFNNLSLVRGSTPMSKWEEYVGDATLNNILEIEEEYVGSYNNDFYYSELLPFTVNAKEKYTFHIEDLEIASGTAPNTQYKVVLSSSSDISTSYNISVGEGGWGTLVIYDGVSNSNAKLNIWKRGTSSATARIKRLSLVKGSTPLMTWEENPNTTKKKLEEWASDGYFSPTEIGGLKEEQTRLDQESAKIVTAANLYSVDTTSFNSAKNNYATIIGNVISAYNNAADKTKAIAVDKADFNTKMSAYYSEKATIEESIDNATKTYTDTSLSTFISQQFNVLKSQVDGKIDTWYQSNDPSLAWTNEEKANHKGDLWYVGGESKIYNGSGWDLVEGVPEALYGEVGRKKQVFYGQPTTPYDVSDLWVQGENGDMMVCKTKRESGGFNSADWTLATKYTDGSNTKNLLPNSQEVTTGTSEYAHARIALPIKVSAGEEYTFKCESSLLTSGSDTAYDVYITGENNNVWLSNKYNLPFGENQSVTIKISATSGGTAVSKREAWLVLYKKTYPDKGANKAVFHNLSLVSGKVAMSRWEDNYEYLYNAFKNGTTKVTGGLVMTQAVMVEDENGTVRGMLNGSNWAEDSTHGRLIVAAGSEGASTSQLAAATTRIYEDGLLETNNIKATGGYFTGGLKATSFLLDFNNMTYPPEQGGGVLIPSQDIDLYAGEGRLEFKNNTNGSIGYLSPVSIYFINGTQTYESVLDADSLYINGGSYGNVEISPSAIEMSKGQFKGLRPNTRSVSSGTTLNEYDHNVFMTSGTINLPSSPLLGQTYKIYHTTTTPLTINGNGKTIKQMRGSTLQDGTSATSSQIEVIELLWSGSYWYGTLNRWD